MLLRRIALGVGLAAALVAAPGPVGVPASAQAAAGCEGTAGTIVFVDFNQLLGGDDIRKGCAPTATNAAVAFKEAGFALAYSPAPGMQGYVCTVNGRPADRDCTGADAYWSLWWADGKGGPWTYSTLGVDSLDVPPGGYVAFSWHEGAGTTGTKPDVVPTRRVAPAPPKPSSKPTPTTGGPTGGSSPDKGAGKDDGEDSEAESSASASPSSTPSRSASASATARASAKASSTPTDATTSALPEPDDITAGPETDDVAHADDEDGPIPTWAAVGLGVGVLGAAGAVPLIRRRLG